jgi:lipopolysaccharide cholinephosphotransferase
MEFPKGFFQEETRDDFTICEMMKRAWAAEMELLAIVSDICDNHGLTYYATGGTLLGAVRHKGFIPWDDDIDITMLRGDYNKLIAVLPEELPEGIVIAGMYAKNERLQKANNFPHLRVIADEEYWSFPAYLKRFHGFPYPRIGIDIFPMDYLTPDMALRKFQFSTYHTINFTLQNWELYIKEGLLKKQLREIETTCEVRFDRDSYLPTQLWLLLDQIAQLADPSECREATNLQYAAETSDAAAYHDRPLEWYADNVMLPFEHITISVPVGYKEVLTSDFGDYMKPVRFTADHEYPFYQKQEAELKAIFAAQGIDTPIEEFCRNWQKATGEE